jgi:hypothetical protein
MNAGAGAGSGLVSGYAIVGELLLMNEIGSR